MSSIQLPDSLESIDKCAFVDCDSLTNITIPKNVSSIGSNAFGYKVEKDTFVKGNDMTITGNILMIRIRSIPSHLIRWIRSRLQILPFR